MGRDRRYSSPPTGGPNPGTGCKARPDLYCPPLRPVGLHQNAPVTTVQGGAVMISSALQSRSARDLPECPSPMRLLIIEDDRDAADYLAKAFREVGHVADLASDGEGGLAQALEGQYDVLIVDRMLPKLDGLSVIGTLRSKGVDTPALILSALGQVDDRVKGLRAGGDDYLAKPYAFSELLARTEVLS